ncbi:DUF1214 domain-containing protein [Nocardia aobensis]|uniref:DUF1214 domain-containing protein n=1 Tax=Nocardia aobensis TaxID=257277 RepID=UPI0009FBCCDE|nr:DUF1214 domain-containing protein [Nocardia aobensis]
MDIPSQLRVLKSPFGIPQILLHGSHPASGDEDTTRSRSRTADSGPPVGHAGQFLTPNPITRYAIAGDTPDMVPNSDHSIDVSIQSQEPQDGKQKANWLPAPANGKAFILFGRAYIPGPAVISGDFTMPPVTRNG